MEYLNEFNILSTNLKLLGFDQNYKKEFSNLNVNSFTKANANLMCTIIYFLLVKYDENIKQKFTFCFPVATLKELKDFKEIAYGEIKLLLNDNFEGLCMVGKSILDSAMGDRLINLLRIISDNVLKNEIFKLSTNSSNSNKDRNLNSINEDVFIKILITDKDLLKVKRNCLYTNIVLMKDKIIEKSININKVQTEWKSFAINLTNELQTLEKEKNVLEKKLSILKKKDTSIFTEISALDRAPKLENQKVFVSMVNQLNSTLIDNKEFVNNISYLDERDKIYEYVIF
jgi:hypothetical protein